MRTLKLLSISSRNAPRENKGPSRVCEEQVACLWYNLTPNNSGQSFVSRLSSIALYFERSIRPNQRLPFFMFLFLNLHFFEYFLWVMMMSMMAIHRIHNHDNDPLWPMIKASDLCWPNDNAKSYQIVKNQGWSYFVIEHLTIIYMSLK